MCRSIQSMLLVVCVVTLSNHVQLGKSQFDVNILLRAWLISSLSDIKSNLSSIQTTVNALEGTVNTLAKEIEQFTSETASHFAEIKDHVNQSDTQLMEIEELICDIHGCHECGGTGGWRRVVYLDMTDPNTDCPPGWNMTNYDIRICGRASDDYDTCYSVYYTVSGGEYSQVCGKMKAYQFGWASGFAGYNQESLIVAQANFSGVAVMHSHHNIRQHIWSFISGGPENWDRVHPSFCLCDTPVIDIEIPPSVGDDYFCESGHISPGPRVLDDELFSFHSDDPLWDGDGCHSTSTCCTFNNPPYFTKRLDNPTTDDIELQMCCFAPSNRENVAVEHVEIYVK